MGDKRKKPRTTKKTNWENIRSWVGAVLCIAVIVVIVSYIAKLVPSSSAYTPGPIGVTPIGGGTPATPNPARITFSAPIQLTGLSSNPSGYGFNANFEIASDIDGDNVVFFYTQEVGLLTRIFVYNIRTKAIEEVETPWTLSYWRSGSPRIWGDKIVFADQGNIYLYDMGTSPHETIPITMDVVGDECGSPTAPNKNPDIYENWVVWAHSTCSGGRELNSNVYAKNIETGETRQLDPSPYFQRYPRIFQNRVVWEDGRHAFIPDSPERTIKCRTHEGRECIDIYMYDFRIEQLKLQRLTPDYSSQRLPNIYKNTVTWLDDRNYSWSYSDQANVNKKDIYVYDAVTNQVTDVITLPREGYEYYEASTVGIVPTPSIWERFVSYGLDFNYDLYLIPTDIFLYDTKTDTEYKPVREYVQFKTYRQYPVIGGVYPNFSIVYSKVDGSGYNLYMIEAKVR